MAAPRTAVRAGTTVDADAVVAPVGRSRVRRSRRPHRWSATSPVTMSGRGRPRTSPASSGQDGQRGQGHHGVGGEGARSWRPRRRRGRTPRWPGPHRWPRCGWPGAQAEKPPGWLSDMGTNHTPMATAPATTVTPRRAHRRVEATTAMQRQDGERLDDRLPEAGQEPEGDDGGHAVPAPRTGPPGQDDQQRAGHHVEGVGGHDGAAEPGERTGGHHQPRRPAPTHRPPRSRPATTVSPAAAADASAATSTRLWMVPARSPDGSVARP